MRGTARTIADAYPPESRTAFAMLALFWAGLGTDELARRFQVSEATVYNTLHEKREWDRTNEV